jgi:hypothetical protein
MPAKDGFELQDADVELLRSVHELRIATIDHLAALSGRSEIALWRRLRKLRDQRYLASVARLMQKHIYALGSEGMSALIEHGFAERTIAQKRIRHYELKEIGLRHALHVANIHAKLMLLTRSSPIVIDHWQEGPALFDSVDPGTGEPPIPVRPDAYFILRHTERPEGKNKLHCFLEADRSTMSHERMEKKLTGYIAYHEQQLFTRKYPGMKSFRVFTVTETRARAENLARGLQRLIPTAPMQRAYRFMALDDLTLETMLTLPSPTADALTN